MFTVSLSRPSATLSAITASDTAIITITDDDTVLIGIGIDEGTADLDDMPQVVEGEGGGTIELVARLERDVQGRFEVTVSTTDGTATAASGDFTLTPTTLIFDGSSIQTFTVAISDDAIVESTETFSVGLSGVSRGLTASADPATITIIDNDSAAITLSGASLSVAEGAGSVELTATLDNAVEGGFEVLVSTTDGTAMSPGDFTAVSGMTLTFNGDPNEPQTFPVTIIDDSTVEEGEMFTVSLSKAARGGPPSLTVSGTGTVAITITDDDTSPGEDTAGVSITPTTLTVTEEGGEETYTVKLDTAPAGVVTVAVTMGSGATAPITVTPLSLDAYGHQLSGGDQRGECHGDGQRRRHGRGDHLPGHPPDGHRGRGGDLYGCAQHPTGRDRDGRD